MEIVVLVALICAGVGYAIDNGRGCILGLMFGPIGLIIAAVMSSKEEGSKG